MRITTNMLVQQFMQAVKGGEAKLPETGTAITAKIAEVLNGVLTLSLSTGEQVVARDVSSHSFQPGQTVTFEVVGADDSGTLQLRALDDSVEPVMQEDRASALLGRLKLPDTAGNRELIRMLTAFKVPLTPDNVKAAQEMNIQAKHIVQLTAQEGSAILAKQAHVPLNQLAATLTGQHPSPPPVVLNPLTETAIKQDPSPMPSVIASSEPGRVQISRDPSMEPAAETNHPPAEDEAGSAMAKKATTPQGQPVKENEASAKGATPFVPETEGNKNASSVGVSLHQAAKALSFEKIGFILKNQLPGNLATLNALEQVVLGKKTLSHQLQGLLELLPKTEETTSLRESVSAALRAVYISEEADPVELQNQIKALKITLSALSAQASEGTGTSAAAREALTEVKNSLDFLGRLGETATFLHIPVNLGQNTKSMDLYVQRDRSGKKKINPRDTKIFISLDTDHLQRVQCLVEIKDQQLSLGFRAADEDVLSALEQWFPSLNEALKQLGYPEARIQGSVIKQPLSLLDIVQDTVTDRQIDLRV